MKEVRFKDAFTFVCTLTTIISSIVIIYTFLTQYQFISANWIFNSYLTLQISICVTMILWALRFFFYRKGKERLLYTGTCIAIAMMSIYFIVNNVK